ncbi:Yip1 family protein [Kitasatospora sp. NPDC054939]
MAGNRYDNGQGADPRGGWSGPPPYPGPGGPGQAPDGPEYFTAPHQGASGGPRGYDPYAAGPQGGGPYPGGPYQGGPYPGDPQGGGPYPGDGYPAGPGPYPADPYGADQPGHTRAFPIGADPYQGGGEYPEYYGGQGGYGPDGHGRQDGYGQDYGQPDNVGVYRAGGQAAPRTAGPRPQWRELLIGIVKTPTTTFDRTRDHQVWLPALTVSLLYGALAVLGIGLTRDDVVNSTFTVALTAMLAAAIGFTVAGAMLGGVTYALARQFGGDGPWQSTVGLAVLIGWTTDAPRLLLALFLPADNMVVQVLGWATWLLCAALLTVMVRRVHDLPWGKAAGAASLQLLALLVLIKLPVLG